ncbi:DNA polymerase-3 subunit alpha [Atopomonas hussainii]|uniref:DNA polymerase III subunit alpha n=1 Tax=Atopomonas hussainii TaxID=1429083 RepID=A0A1H7IT40_9GAMM|nr:DNA polymerase III subunit alpha [Atopomonas hussainii]SEK65596.1 DNA polymerase-3 subunit alpha [Atopomonas hussainii]
MSVSFVHLRLHTEYSLVDGLVRVKPLIKAVAGAGMPAVAVTDQSNMCALVKFYKTAMGAGIKPLCGADIWLASRDEDGPLTRMTLLAMNPEGYRNLTELVSRGWSDGQSNDLVIIQRDWVKEAANGLIALSGSKEGEVGRALLAGDMLLAETLLREWQAVFGDRFYIEVQRTSRVGDEEHLHGAVELAARCPVALVATNDVRFLKQDDFEAHETRVCIGESRVLDDPRRPRDFSDQQYLKTPEEMAELFSDLPEALANTVEIAKRCNIDVQLGTYFLPDFPTPNGMNIDDYLRHASFEGLEERLKVILPADTPDYAAKKQVYIDRLNFELDIIIQMGFPGYFLIVMDFIQWAKNNDVPVGPGRGSGAGSLVAYVLKITDLDPLAYDLLFERFLNPERISMPDFDVDFCMDGRDRVIDYVADKYGRNAVSQIITFGSMAAKAVVRDVARVQGKSYGLADRLSKMIPFEVGMTLEKAFEMEEPLRDFLKVDEEAQEIWDMALKLEGITRGTGKHAGGVVIAPTKLTDFAPIACDVDGSGLVTQFDKDDVEAAGLVKFDFLGLRTLTIIKWAMETIHREQQRRGETELVNIDLIPLDDKKTYDMLQRAETTAVFQLESRGMKELIKKLKPDCLEDMIALVALFRPGPLQSGMVDDFINRKHGRESISYPHPDYQYAGLEPVLKPTYGIILYQEQVMQIAQVMAGYTLGGADMLRRAMGKKKPEEMAKQRGGFIEGCEKNNISADLAGNIFDLVEKFAGYGFNKSHSAAYGLVSYQTAWLKAHYPAPFMAAVLSADMHNTDKVVTLIEECRSMKLRIDAPDVNTSEFKFTVNEDGRIVYGLGAIKGVGEGPVEAIVEARAAGAFKDLFDFCARVDLKRINKRTLEALIRGGALDRLGPFYFDELKAYLDNIDRNRAVLLASMAEAIQAAEQSAASEASGHMDLFGGVFAEPEADVYANHRQAREMSLKERLGGEKDTLGLYLTGHPIDEYEHEVRRFARQRIVDLKPARGSQTIAGLIVAQRVMKNKRGDKMGFITLDDRSGRIEASLFSEAFSEASALLKTDTLVVVEGEVSMDDFSGGLRLRAKRVMGLEEARTGLAESLRIQLRKDQLREASLRQLGELLSAHKGQCPVSIDYQGAGAKALLRLGETFKVQPGDSLIQTLRDQFGRDSVFLNYR